MKTCSKCKVNKELTEFTKDASRPDGLDRHCRECKTAAKRAYLAQGNNAELKSQRYKEWYQANREILLQKKREKRKDPVEKEKNKAIKAKWIAAMGETAHKEWRKRLRIKYRENIKAYNKMRTDTYPDSEVRAEIRSRCKFSKLANEEIPQEMIEIYRLLRFINRRIKNEECNATT